MDLLNLLHFLALFVNEGLLVFRAAHTSTQFISISLYALRVGNLSVTAELVLSKRHEIVATARHLVVSGHFGHLAVCAAYYLDTNNIGLLRVLLLTIVLLIIYHIYYYF